MKNWGVIVIGVLLTTFGSGRSRPTYVVYNESFAICAQKCNADHSDCVKCPDRSHKEFIECEGNCNKLKEDCLARCKPKVEEKREEEIDFSNFSLWDK